MMIVLSDGNRLNDENQQISHEAKKVPRLQRATFWV